MDLQRLREDTRLEHEATEAAMPLMAPGLTLQAYAEVLRALLPVLRSWERWAEGWAEQHATPELQLLLSKRRRSSWLEADLAVLGESTLPRPEAVADGEVDWSAVVCGEHVGAKVAMEPAEFQAAFLGALYVVEGSTLGGRLIARHLQPLFGFEAGQGYAYFRGHGEQTGALWRETAAAIAGVPEMHAPLLTEAARRSFQVFRAALGRLREEASPAAGRR